MTEREFWITVRAALIMFVRAIEKRYNLPEWRSNESQDKRHDPQGEDIAGTAKPANEPKGISAGIRTPQN